MLQLKCLQLVLYAAFAMDMTMRQLVFNSLSRNVSHLTQRSDAGPANGVAVDGCFITFVLRDSAHLCNAAVRTGGVELQCPTSSSSTPSERCYGPERADQFGN